MLNIKKEMGVLIEACGNDNILENCPFQRESKEAMIDKEMDIIRSNPYAAGRWLEACRESPEATKILKKYLKAAGVTEHGIWIIKNYNDHSKTLSSAVFAFSDLLINTFKTYRALGVDQKELTDDERFDALDDFNVFAPDAETCDRILKNLSEYIKDMVEDYLDGSDKSISDTGDLGVLALAIDVANDPLEWLNIAALYDSNKFGENTAPILELNEVIGGFLNG
jgi:hypothetical protein